MSGMTSGQIVGGVVGAAIGFFTPLGPVLGWTIGAGVGGLIDPPVVEGPRRDDLKVQASEYGKPIPILYGINATAGNVIWASDLIEVEGGGSGKGGPEQKTFTYLANFAVLICEGERALGRIWAGPEKRLVRDANGILESGTITFYSGTSDQLPDPLMESYEGVGFVPGYRGWCYLVWENFDTSNDGNMLPFLTIETGDTGTPAASGDLGTVWPVGPVFVDEAAGTYSVSYSGTRDGVVTRNLADDSFVANFQPESNWLSSITQAFYDPDRARIVYLQTASYQWIDTLTGTTGEATVFSGWSGLPGGGGWLPKGGVYHNGYYIFLMEKDGSPNAYGVSILDPDTTVAGQFVSIDFIIIDLGSYTLLGGFCGSRDPADTYVIGVTTAGDVRKFVLTLAGGSTSIGACPANPDHAAVDPNTGYVWVYKFGSGVLDVSVHDPATEAVIYSGSIATEAFTIGAGSRLNEPFVFGGGKVTLIAYKFLATDYLIQFDASTPTTPELITGRYHGSADLYAGWWNPVTSTFWFERNFGWANSPTTDLTAIAIHDGDNETFPGTGFLLGDGGAEVLSTQTLADVVADLLERAGLDASQYDVTALEADTVDGFGITRTPVRAAIEQLQRGYYFDLREHATETGMVVQAVKRGSLAIREIPDADVGAYQAGGQAPSDPLQSVKRMPDELARTLTVNYTLAATDYSTATRYARRLVGDFGDEKTLDLALVLTDTKAQEVAEVNLHTEHVQALSHSFTLPRQYGDVEPCDILGVFGHVIFVTQVTRAFNGSVIQIQGVTDDSGSYDPHVVVEETPPNSQTVDEPGLVLMDMM